MHPLQKHYYNVVQRDLILSELTSTVSIIPSPQKIVLCLGGASTSENDVISSLSALYIIGNQKPFVTQKKAQVSSILKESVGGKMTLRKTKMFQFWYKLLFNVLPRIRQFEGLKSPAHKKAYCFILKDIFSFEDLISLFPYFEDLGSLQCQFHFTTKSKNEVAVLGQCLQLCFIPE
uniref:ribosomal protein L5 n=1 Tax=Cutleria multifida TaxID=74475 RepID=UPI002E7770D2|nr:ribosomal protein L5 [Cutleria multifida]WBP69879.1 ribosomal protein L5 [Cutleria multifida]